MSFFTSMDTSFSSFEKAGRCSTYEASLHTASKCCKLDGKGELPHVSTGRRTESCCCYQGYLKLPGRVQSFASLSKVRETMPALLYMHGSIPVAQPPRWGFAPRHVQDVAQNMIKFPV